MEKKESNFGSDYLKRAEQDLKLLEKDMEDHEELFKSFIQNCSAALVSSIKKVDAELVVISDLPWDILWVEMQGRAGLLLIPQKESYRELVRQIRSAIESFLAQKSTKDEALDAARIFLGYIKRIILEISMLEKS